MTTWSLIIEGSLSRCRIILMYVICAESMKTLLIWQSMALCSQHLGSFMYHYFWTTGCPLADLISTDAVRQCAGRGFVNTLHFPSGLVCYNRTTTGSEVVYMCDDGFQQDGPATRVCQSDGVWNGSIPHCSRGQDGIMSSVSVRAFWSVNYYYGLLTKLQLFEN